MILRLSVLHPPRLTPLSELFLPGILSQSLNLGFPDMPFLVPGGFPLVIVFFFFFFFQHNQVLFLKMNEFINFVYSMSFSEADKVSWHLYKLWRAGTLLQTPLLACSHPLPLAGRGNGDMLTGFLSSPQPQRQLPAPSRPPGPHPPGAGSLPQREHGRGQRPPGLSRGSSLGSGRPPER